MSDDERRRQKPRITLTLYRIKLPPAEPRDLIQILIEGTDGGVWEDFCALEELPVFEKGLRAGAATIGQVYLSRLDIPRKPKFVIELPTPTSDPEGED